MRNAKMKASTFVLCLCKIDNFLFGIKEIKIEKENRKISDFLKMIDVKLSSTLTNQMSNVPKLVFIQVRVMILMKSALYFVYNKNLVLFRIQRMKEWDGGCQGLGRGKNKSY